MGCFGAPRVWIMLFGYPYQPESWIRQRVLFTLADPISFIYVLFQELRCFTLLVLKFEPFCGWTEQTFLWSVTDLCCSRFFFYGFSFTFLCKFFSDHRRLGQQMLVTFWGSWFWSTTLYIGLPRFSKTKNAATGCICHVVEMFESQSGETNPLVYSQDWVGVQNRRTTQRNSSGCNVSSESPWVCSNLVVVHFMVLTRQNRTEQ